MIANASVVNAATAPSNFSTLHTTDNCFDAYGERCHTFACAHPTRVAVVRWFYKMTPLDSAASVLASGRVPMAAIEQLMSNFCKCLFTPLASPTSLLLLLLPINCCELRNWAKINCLTRGVVRNNHYVL